MKQRIRQQVRATLAAMTPQTEAAKSALACRAVAGLDEFAGARVVMAYLEIPHEVATVDLLSAAWADDKIVLVPRIVPHSRQMLALPIRSLDAGIELTQRVLREPAAGEPWPVEQIDLIVTPGLAFDRAGNRLGRGGGYYDRFLALPGMRAVTCGLAFAEQMVDDVPTGPHDLPMDMIVTDADVIRFDRRTAECRQSRAGQDSMET